MQSQLLSYSYLWLIGVTVIVHSLVIRDDHSTPVEPANGPIETLQSPYPLHTRFVVPWSRDTVALDWTWFGNEIPSDYAQQLIHEAVLEAKHWGDQYGLNNIVDQDMQYKLGRFRLLIQPTDTAVASDHRLTFRALGDAVNGLAFAWPYRGRTFDFRCNIQILSDRAWVTAGRMLFEWPEIAS